MNLLTLPNVAMGFHLAAAAPATSEPAKSPANPPPVPLFQSGQDGGNTCGNPCVVTDRHSGTISLLHTWNRSDDHEGQIIAGKSKDTRRVFLMQSADGGLSWCKPREITSDVKKPDWTWYATGPGSGIQLEHGPHKGRLLIPSALRFALNERNTHHTFRVRPQSEFPSISTS